ncbi:hypothetical protein GYMLUDRAFT_254519 [Collybiopsis luxurians FD-317 M1]|nr:hypothetical protein GYMLUDRAFT_254519 [Collybiopsis luxurians FD-317 M1]
MDSFLSSSQNFVRALKANSDPPSPESPSKIEIARAAWNQKSFYAPRKAELIVDFILTRFIKNEIHFLTDIPSWQLLLDVCQSANFEPWLAPLVHRISFARIIIQFLQSIQNTLLDTNAQLTRLMYECTTILWPLCVSKMSSELLLECFGASLRFCRDREPNEYIGHIIINVTNSFDRSLNTSSSKKKIFSVFVQTYFEDWFSSLSKLYSSLSHSNLLESIYATGSDCFLNLDVLRDGKTETVLFSALESIAPDIIAPSLPRIFSSYVQTLKKNRSVIFGQGSKLDSLEEFHEASLKFLTSCQTTLNMMTDKGQVWKTRALLLDVVNEENVFNTRHVETEKLLSGIVNSILIELAGGHEDSLGPAISCLTSLTRIDYRLIESVLPDILSQALLIPHSISSAMELLETVIQYHAKTRTMTVYIETLMSVNFRDSVTADLCQKFYERMCHSAALHPIHLDRLGRCSHDFLPLNQTITAVRCVTEHTQSLWEEYQSCKLSEEGESPRKTRKLKNGKSSDDSLASTVALKLSAVASLASILLTWFSAESVPKESQEELAQLLNHFSSKVVLHSLSTMFKIANRKAENPSWNEEIVMLAFLRLLYALGLRRSPNLSLVPECSPNLIQQMSESIHSIALPELRLEILRTLFKSAPEERRPAILNLVLTILNSSAEAPEGFSVLHLVTQRWLPLIDLQASKAQLEQFIEIFVRLRTQGREHSTSVLLVQVLTSAEFWELPNIRSALLAFIDQSTSIVDDWTTITPLQEQFVSSVFDTLLFVPTEYLTRSMRIFLVKRAIILDQAIAESHTSQLLRNVRICIARILSSMDHSENLVRDLNPYLQHLHHSRASVESINTVPETTKLIEYLLKTVLKNGTSEELLQLVKQYSENLEEDSFLTTNSWVQSFRVLVKTLLEDFPLKNVAPSAQAAFKDLFDALHRRLFPTLTELLMDQSPSNLARAKGVLQGWQQVLKLGHWLELLGGVVPLLGEQVVQWFALAHRTPGAEDAQFIIFGVLLEEFSLCEASIQNKQLETVIAAYVLLGRQGSEFEEMNNSISSICSALSPATYNYALDLILSSFRGADGNEINRLVHLSTTLLQNNPQNTLQIVQNFVTESINIFNTRSVFLEGARLSALHLLLQRCRDRPATLRQIDVSGIWLYFSKVCVGSEVHDSTTSSETFHCVVSITTALVRLRRDLVVLSLPQMGVVLRRLIQSMQNPRPNLGPKQSAMVSRGLPLWINSREPLGIEESKVLSRLLESLTAKTVVKKLTISTTIAPKAESLAKPFSKHAAYVAKAYVEALNDPLCALPAVVRKELQPGLYALCGMINDFARDALMASTTDAGEKAILKSLWREYEKQRYVGKG